MKTLQTLKKTLIIINTVVLIVGYTYVLYLLLFDGKGNIFLVNYLMGFALLAGIINFTEKQKILAVLMFILVIFFTLFSVFCFFNSEHSSC